MALLARDNALRDELNLAARAEAQARGWLAGPALVVRGREYRAGDRVVARRNDRALDTDDGDRGTVSEVRPERGLVMVGTDDGRQVAYPAAYLVAGLLEHGYALTGHGTQGATLERAIRVARPEDHGREWTYTADSREREASPSFLIDEPTVGEEAAGEEAHGTIGYGVFRRDAVGRYLRALVRSEAEPLAREQRAPASEAPVGPLLPQALRLGPRRPTTTARRAPSPGLGPGP